METTGRVISLDRGYPLVLTTPPAVRAQHAIDLIKNTSIRASVGDFVDVEFPPGQDMPLITRIHERGHTLVRRSLVESRHEGAGKHDEQVLAANFDLVIVVTALGKHPLEQDYLERQLVMAHQSGAAVAVLLTKADLAADADGDLRRAQQSAPGSSVLLLSTKTKHGLDALRHLLSGQITAVLLGRSGVGKSTLVNLLLGEQLLATGEVRERDHAGRHTTVARRMVFLPTGAALIDTPGLRSVGLYDAHEGLSATFPEIEALAARCRYRDCSHSHEPGCAPVTAEQNGTLPARRLASYRALFTEVKD